MGVSADRRCLHQGVQESAQLRVVIAQESFVRNAGLTDRLAEVETLLRSCSQPYGCNHEMRHWLSQTLCVGGWALRTANLTTSTGGELEIHSPGPSARALSTTG